MIFVKNILIFSPFCTTLTYDAPKSWKILLPSCILFSNIAGVLVALFGCMLCEATRNEHFFTVFSRLRLSLLFVRFLLPHFFLTPQFSINSVNCNSNDPLCLRVSDALSIPNDNPGPTSCFLLKMLCHWFTFLEHLSHTFSLNEPHKQKDLKNMRQCSY